MPEPDPAVLILYSDNASFPELLEMVEASGASHIDVVHGYTEPFARLLRLRGYNAHAAGSVMPTEVQV